MNKPIDIKLRILKLPLSLAIGLLYACQYEGWASEHCYILPAQEQLPLAAASTCECPDYLKFFRLAGAVNGQPDEPRPVTLERGYAFELEDMPEDMPDEAALKAPIRKKQKQTLVSDEAEPQEIGTSCVDINQAGSEELMRLPGIGATRAQSIIQARSKRPFKNKRDVTRIKGIGKKSYQKLAPKLCDI